MKLKELESFILRNVHYQRSYLAGLQTLVQTLGIKKSVVGSKEQALVDLLGKRISEVDFRMQLFLDLLLSGRKPKHIQLEFLELFDLVKQSLQGFECKLETKLTKSEILSDREILSQILFYQARLSALKSTTGQFKLRISNSERFVLLNYLPVKPKKLAKIETDIELEEKMLEIVIKSFCGWLKVQHSEIKEGKTGSYRLTIPLRFTP